MTTFDHHHRAVDRPPAAQQWLPVLRTLHEGAAERCSHTLSQALRRSCTVRLTGVDDVAYGDFVYSLEQPTFVCVLTGGKPPVVLALEINHSILFPLLDCLLGGNPDTSGLLVPHRALTEIERRLATRLVGAIVEQLTAVWQCGTASEPKSISASESEFRPCLAVERVESDPTQVRLADRADRVVLVSLEIALGNARGLLNVCLPWPAVIALIGELPQPFVPDTTPASPAEFADDESAVDDFQDVAHTPRRVVETAPHRRGALVELVVELDGGQISHQDLQALQAGDIITTCQGADEPLIATVDGQPRFLVRPGSLGGQKAIEVQRELAVPASEGSRRAG